MGGAPTRIIIEFEPADPVQGRLIDAGGADHAFYGWLELTRALECAREDRRSDAPGVSSRARPASSAGVP